MIFKSKENECLFKILKILNKGKSKYSIMFKETKISHTTLQRVLNYLIKQKFVKKYNLGHMNVDYKISSNGKRLLKKLKELKEILN